MRKYKLSHLKRFFRNELKKFILSLFLYNNSRNGVFRSTLLTCADFFRNSFGKFHQFALTKREKTAKEKKSKLPKNRVKNKKKAQAVRTSGRRETEKK